LAGACNRIKGNKLSDDEVEACYRNMHIRKFKTSDEKEAAGYLEMLELVLISCADMPVTKALILQLHRNPTYWLLEISVGSKASNRQI